MMKRRDELESLAAVGIGEFADHVAVRSMATLFQRVRLEFQSAKLSW